MKIGKLPRGLRRVETDAPEHLPLLKSMIPEYRKESCIEALNIMIITYQELREYFVTDDFVKRSEAEIHVLKYFNNKTF
jgi:hypothetical protein